jgi:hypothetical protein
MKQCLCTLVTGAALLFAGCAGSMKYIDISKNAPIAVVGFTLNKSIVEEGKAPDRGPGLLQKAVDYYRNHQAAVNQLWADFKGQYRDVLLESGVIDIETIAVNDKYRELTKHVPKMMLGVDVAPGANELTADGGLQYVYSSDKALMENLATQLNAKLLVCIEYTASYAMSAGIQIGGIGGGAAKMKLRASLSMYEKGKGIVAQQSFSEESDESFPIIQGILLSENYAKGLSSAQKKILSTMKKYLLDNQVKANVTVTKS